MPKYDFAAIENKWQAYWAQHNTFVQPNPGQKGFREGPKFYVLDMFPYPSGAGLHVGHPEGYTATDIVARYKRAKGFNVLHPMGYDSFGLPAEQYAVEHGVHPRVTTAQNIANIERQIKMFGFSYDWTRRLATTDPDYYRWTQWIFLQLFNSWFDPEAQAARPIAELERNLLSGQYVVDFGGNVVPANQAFRIPDINLHGTRIGELKYQELEVDQRRRLLDEYRLAYQAEVPVNWCPQLGTVLANEEVTNEGRSDRGNFPVYRRALRQWMLRITAYAARLEKDLDILDWPDSVKLMQRNWIGKSQGAEVDFPVVPPSLGGTAFPGCADVTPGSEQLDPTEEFSRLAKADPDTRVLLLAQDFEGCNPYPPGEPATPDLMKYIRNLPHVQVPGATYFVTWRCQNGTTLAPAEREIVFQSMLHWHGQRCIVFAAVVLENHAHMILKPTGDWSLQKVIQSIKGYSAKLINEERGGRGHIWQDETFDHVIRDSLWLTRFIYYICDNPITKRLASSWLDYPYLFVNASIVSTEASKPFGHTCTAWKGCATNSQDLNSQGLEEWFSRRAKKGYPQAAEGRTIRVYTTRPDTLYGATYMVLAPEHPLVEEITSAQQKPAVQAYVAAAANKSELERMTEGKEKTGVFTGAYAVNPVTRRNIPVWVADYVMMGYGTGAIMAVPAHDTRDLEFARKFNLPVIQVVQPPAGQAWQGFVDDGVAVNSGPYDGLPTPHFKAKIATDLVASGLGKATINYKLRDWLFARQRYWGEPIPVIHCDKCGTVPVPDNQLPLTLPEMDDFTPSASEDPDALPKPPLAKAVAWVETTCPACGGAARRETNTMPQWAGSCWYYLRYLDPKNASALVDPKAEKYWMAPGGVDLYVGGAEHAVLHLLYARFWHKVLFDLGYVSTPEPFGKLFNQGMIRSFAYRDSRGVSVAYDDVDASGEKPRHRQSGEVLTESVEKMSKSLKNVINPDEVIAQYGSDTFRLYEMFMGPLETSKPWNTRDVPGVHRFLNRVWRMMLGSEDQPALLGSTAVPAVERKDTGETPVLPDEVERALHKLIKKVGEDLEAMKFNTAIAALMEFVNTVYKAGTLSPSQARRFLLVLAPFAPHIAEELWQQLGGQASLAYELWPDYDESLLAQETIEIPVQINGKLRSRIRVAPDAPEEAMLAAALADEKVAAALAGKSLVKKIVVPGRMVNLVIR